MFLEVCIVFASIITDAFHHHIKLDTFPMNVTLGFPTENYEPVALKDMTDGSIRRFDIETGLSFDSSPVTVKSLQSVETAISILQVTVRRPFTKKSIAAITWSLFPYVVPIFTVLSFIRFSVISVGNGEPLTKGYSGFLFFYIIFAIFCVILNERVLKRIIQEPRPSGSASKSYGMPSGHCTSCYAWMIWCLVEIIVHPASSLGLTLFLIFLTIVVLGPVPYARVYLQDHTSRQVLVGMLVGSVLGVLAVPIRMLLFPSATPLWQ